MYWLILLQQLILLQLLFYRSLSCKILCNPKTLYNDINTIMNQLEYNALNSFDIFIVEQKIYRTINDIKLYNKIEKDFDSIHKKHVKLEEKYRLILRSLHNTDLVPF